MAALHKSYHENFAPNTIVPIHTGDFNKFRPRAQARSDEWRAMRPKWAKKIGEIALWFLIARLARLVQSDPRNHFSVQKKNHRAIYSILVYFTMFSFHLNSYQYWIWTSLEMFQHVQTCLRITWIVTIHIMLNLNKFRQVWESHESQQFISYWIWTSSDMFEQVQTCLNMFRHVWE